MKRPLLFACFFFMGVIFTARIAGLPVDGRMPDPEAERLVNEGAPVTVSGRVAVCEARRDCIYLLLKDYYQMKYLDLLKKKEQELLLI